MEPISTENIWEERRRKYLEGVNAWEKKKKEIEERNKRFQSEEWKKLQAEQRKEQEKHQREQEKRDKEYWERYHDRRARIDPSSRKMADYSWGNNPMDGWDDERENKKCRDKYSTLDIYVHY